MTAGNGEVLDAFFAALLDDDPEELYDRAPCGYLSTSPDGIIVKTNATFLTLLGYEREELVGKVRFAELLSPGGQIYHETHYAPLLRMQDAAREIALDIVRRDGSRLPVLVNAVLERDAQGEPWIIRIAVFDATQRREYERELLRAKKRAEVSEAQARSLARTLQQTLIPPTMPVIPGLDVAAQYRPAGDGTEVGGDFYDLFQVGPGDWVVVIGDVCGKGVDAAVVTALVRYTLRAAAVQHPDPAEALTMLNEVLLKHKADRFCTVAFLRLKETDGEWSGHISLGGHPPPMVRSADGSLQVVGEPGSLLGVLDDPEFLDTPVTLRQGDTIVLFTDGLLEGRRGKSFYGELRVRTMLAGSQGSATDTVTAMLEDVLRFQGGIARDDVAIVAARVPDTVALVPTQGERGREGAPARLR